MVTQKNMGSRSFWQDLEILKAFLISLILHGLFFLFWSLKTFYQGVSGWDLQLGSQRLAKSQILLFATPNGIKSKRI